MSSYYGFLEVITSPRSVCGSFDYFNCFIVLIFFIDSQLTPVSALLSESSPLFAFFFYGF